MSLKRSRLRVHPEPSVIQLAGRAGLLTYSVFHGGFAGHSTSVLDSIHLREQQMKGFNCCVMIELGRNTSGLFLTALCQRKRCLLFKAFQNRETLKMYFTLSAHSAHENRNETGKNRKVKLA